MYSNLVLLRPSTATSNLQSMSTLIRDTKFEGFGVFQRYPDNTTEHLGDCWGNNCSKYESELIAIKSSIELLHQQFETNEEEPTDVIIFNDSSSALDAVQIPLLIVKKLKMQVNQCIFYFTPSTSI